MKPKLLILISLFSLCQSAYKVRYHKASARRRNDYDIFSFLANNIDDSVQFGHYELEDPPPFTTPAPTTTTTTRRPVRNRWSPMASYYCKSFSIVCKPIFSDKYWVIVWYVVVPMHTILIVINSLTVGMAEHFSSHVIHKTWSLIHWQNNALGHMTLLSEDDVSRKAM